MTTKIRFLKPQFTILKNFPIPRIENDFKLQCLLIYAHDRISYITECHNLDKGINIFNIKDNEFVLNFLKTFCNEVEEYIPTFSELEKEKNSILNQNNLTNIHNLMLVEYEPLSKFYGVVVKESEKIFKEDTVWIPDLIAISLINMWVNELDKRTFTYTFLYKYDFQKILDLYNKISLESKNKNTSLYDTIQHMYDSSENIIKKINNTKYKTIFTKAKAKTKRKNK